MGELKMAPSRRIERIVVGLDGSAGSQAALRWAIDMAMGMGSAVTAVYAVDLPSFYPEPAALPLLFDDAWRKTIRAEFEQTWCKPMREAGIRYRAVMEDGRAASVISRVAHDEDADIIVVGRRGRGGVAELFLGSASHELVLRSRIPVLVVEPEPVKKPKGGPIAA
jgi:nucleotide-binding universal stress UspA family protein